MAQVTVRINGRGYDVACDDGQEGHLISLAEYVDAKVSHLADAVGQIGDVRLLVMACLLVADELSEARQEAGRLRAMAEGAGARDPNAGLGESIDALARRIESIAATLERA